MKNSKTISKWKFYQNAVLLLRPTKSEGTLIGKLNDHGPVRVSSSKLETVTVQLLELPELFNCLKLLKKSTDHWRDKAFNFEKVKYCLINTLTSR